MRMMPIKLFLLHRIRKDERKRNEGKKEKRERKKGRKQGREGGREGEKKCHICRQPFEAFLRPECGTLYNPQVPCITLLISLSQFLPKLVNQATRQTQNSNICVTGYSRNQSCLYNLSSSDVSVSPMNYPSFG